MKSSLTKPLLEAVNKAASEVLKKEYELAQKEFKEFILELAKS